MENQKANERLFVVTYSRVSSKEQEREGYSIPAQEDLLRGYGHQQGMVIRKEFVDVESASSSGRPSFEEMLAFLKKPQNGCRTILVEKTDRLYRNIKDYSRVRTWRHNSFRQGSHHSFPKFSFVGATGAWN